MTPDGWKALRLGDVVSFEYGKSLSSSRRRGGPVPVCGSNGIVGYHDESLVRGPGVVVGRKGSVGAVAWMDCDFWPIDTTYYVNLTSQTDARWLYYALSNLGLEKLNEATGVPGLNRSTAARLRFQLPPVLEQRKIAAILSSVEAAIERTRAVIGQLQTVKRGTMQNLLTRGLPGRHGRFETTEIGELPEGWRLLPLRNFVAKGPDNGLYRPQRDYGTGTPIVRIDTFDNGAVLRHPKLRRVSVSSVDLDRFRVKRGDILINRVNSISHLAKCALAKSFSEPTVYESNMMRLTLDDAQILTEFGFLWLSSDKAKRHLRRRAKRAVAQASVNQTDVLTIPTPCPPKAEQERIVDISGALERRLQADERTLTGLSDLKSSLMSVLLTGELRVTPDPEPA